MMATCSPSGVYQNDFTSVDQAGINATYPPPPPECDPTECSPIVIDRGQTGIELTEPSVWFDLQGFGVKQLFGWVEASGGDGFVAMDRNGDGEIQDGRELFGNFTPLSWDMDGARASNGFVALRWFDDPQRGGNADGWISTSDAVYGKLLFWRDLNGDGHSQRSELASLAESGILAIGVEFRSASRRDRHGNVLRYRSEALIGIDDVIERRLVYDVYFTTTGAR